ncbi:MAG: leucine-rich repeat domain-containing protein [Butyrivibrio sp.]
MDYIKGSRISRFLFIIIFAVISGIFLSSCGFNEEKPEDTSFSHTTAPDETTTPSASPRTLDPAISAAICSELGYEQGTALSDDDLERVTYLALWNEPVHSLEGISMLGNLEELYIGSGEISDISELALIPSIRSISISNCYITEIPDFSQCHNLTQLYLPCNLIEDLTPLNVIPSLLYADFNSNRIASIASIANINNLESLALMSNCILDYNSISENKSLIKALEEGTQCTYEQCIAVEERAKEIVSDIVNESDLDKEKYIYQYVIDTMNFDDSMRDSKAYAYQGLFEGTGVCADYAEVFCMLACHAGLECYECVSDTHAWNMVKIDGHYYHCDSLWDDTDAEWIYFNRETADILEVPDHFHDTSRYPQN